MQMQTFITGMTEPGRACTAPIRVIIADRQPVLRYGLSRLLEDEHDIDIVGTASSVEELYAQLNRTSCDLLVCDYNFSNDSQPDGLQMVERILRTYPEIRTIFTSTLDQFAMVARVVELGADGFIRKGSEDLIELAKIIRKVIGGSKYFDSETSSIVLQRFGSGGAGYGNGSLVDLSLRELEVMRMWSSGMTVTEIAAVRRRSCKTISAQKKAAMKKLGARNSVELLTAAKRLFS